MSKRGNYLTVIISEPTQEEASELIRHPKMSATSWSHAIHDRDAKDAEISELRATLQRCKEVSDMTSTCWRQDQERFEAEVAELRNRLEIINSAAQIWKRESEVSADERDEARECVGRLSAALSSIERIENRDHGPDWEEIEEARGIASAALASTPEHLR